MFQRAKTENNKGCATFSPHAPLSPAEALERAKQTGDWSAVHPDVVEQQRRAIQLLTISEVPGRVIDSSVGIVFGDYAFAYGAIYEELAGLLRNIGGSGRSTKTHTMLQEARETVLGQMREQALLLGADAVVGVRLDFEEFTGANQRGILVVTGLGTAVRLRSLDSLA